MPDDLKRAARTSYPPSLLEDFGRSAPGIKLLLGLYLVQMLVGLAAGFVAPWIEWK